MKQAIALFIFVLKIIQIYGCASQSVLSACRNPSKEEQWIDERRHRCDGFKIVKMDLTKKIVLTTNARTTSLNARTVKSASGAIGSAMVRNIVSMDLTKKTVHTLAQLICLNVLMV